VSSDGVPEDETMPAGQVVVGLDGSPSARAALQWAAAYARVTGSRLRAVYVGDVAANSAVWWSAGFAGAAYLGEEEADQEYRAELGELFDSVTPEPGWVIEFSRGPAGSVLVQRSANAQLLVLGTREHTGVGRLLAGSVSHYCLSHAHCPVVAVPAPERSTAGSSPSSPSSHGSSTRGSDAS